MTHAERTRTIKYVLAGSSRCLLHRRRDAKKMNTPVLDVLTPLPDCRQEPVEKMERRISGVSYMYWIDFYNEIFWCGFSCARLVSFSFSGSLPQRGLPRSTALISGYHAEGHHARTDTFELTGYHVCRVTTPELPRSI